MIGYEEKNTLDRWNLRTVAFCDNYQLKVYTRSKYYANDASKHKRQRLLQLIVIEMK